MFTPREPSSLVKGWFNLMRPYDFSDDRAMVVRVRVRSPRERQLEPSKVTEASEVGTSSESSFNLELR